MERVFTSLVARYKSERLFWSTDQKNWTTRRQHLVDIWPEMRWKGFAGQSNVKMHPHVSYDRSCTAPAVVPTDYRRDGSLLVAGVFWKEHAKPEESMPERHRRNQDPTERSTAIEKADPRGSPSPALPLRAFAPERRTDSGASDAYTSACEC
jgi:hypothetical protein